jgi:nucleoside transporter
MNSTVRVKLSVMMFLEFFIWGAWYVTMGTYLSTVLKADSVQIGATYSAMAVANIISPFFTGMIADRFFAAQKLLGLLHILGAILLYFITQVTDPSVFYWVLLLYSMMYAPTISLTSSISFRQMSDGGKQFSGIRVWGTIGWIAIGQLLDKAFHIAPENLAITFQIAALASVILGLFSFTLPDTPPTAKNQPTSWSQILGSDSFVLFKDRSFLVFFISAILIFIPLSFYYSQTNQFLTEVGMKNATSNMTLGQISEALFILAIPFLINRIGIKWMIMVGMIAWILRFVLFGYGNGDANLWMLFVGIILHGVCFDFFFVTGQIYTDGKAGEKIKAAAQGMITMATYGFGMWGGTLLSGYVAQAYTINETTHDWLMIWLIPAGIAAAVLVLFALFFNEKK